MYARVSTKDKGQDPEVQLLQLRRYCIDYKKYEIVDTITDKTSGKTPKRPGLKKLVAGIEAHKYDVVVILRIDRIMRSLPHFLNLVDIMDKNNVRLESSSDGLDYSSPTGSLVRNVLASVAQFEGELASERSIEGQEKARAEGKTIGRPVVDIDLDRFLGLIKQPGMTKAKACGCLHYSQGTVNNRLRKAGLGDLVREPTRASAKRGKGENKGELIKKGTSDGIGNKHLFVADKKEATPLARTLSSDNSKCEEIKDASKENARGEMGWE